MEISGIWLIDAPQSLAVKPSLQMHDPLTHLPLKVQSFGHNISTMSDRSEGISGAAASPLLSFAREEIFLPAISPHSFIITVTIEIANEVSPVSWNLNNRDTFLT